MSSKPTMLGNFEELLLLAIINLGEDAYGVPIRQAVGGALERDVSVGALYTTLERLEKKGYITSIERDATKERGNRAKRYYRVEGSGIAALRNAESVRQRARNRDLAGGIV